MVPQPDVAEQRRVVLTTDIMVNGPGDVDVERAGRLESRGRGTVLFEGAEFVRHLMG